MYVYQFLLSFLIEVISGCCSLLNVALLDNEAILSLPFFCANNLTTFTSSYIYIFAQHSIKFKLFKQSDKETFHNITIHYVLNSYTLFHNSPQLYCTLCNNCRNSFIAQNIFQSSTNASVLLLNE